MAPKIPLLDRLLLGLVRGPGAEFVVGDVVERYADDLAGGLSATDARRRLRRQVLKTAVRWWTTRRRNAGAELKPTGGDGMGTWWTDARLSMRSLARRPGLALTVVATLGMGIGATSTIWSVVDAVLIRPLPYEDAGSLILVGNTFPRREWDDQEAGLQHLAGVSVKNWEEYRARIRSFASLEALEYTNVLLPDRGQGPEIASAVGMSEGFLQLLNVSPALGRTFLPEEYRSGGPAVTMLTYGTWMRRFGGDPEVIGTAMNGPGGGGAIVGVLPQGFEPPEALSIGHPEFWLPLQPDHRRYADRGRRSLVLLGRLADGVTLDEARAEARRVAESVARDFPDGNTFDDGGIFGIGANGLKDETVGASRRALLLFLGASGLLLLIAILNSATLLLARTLERARELGVRSALGAGSAALVRLLLTESVILAAGGGVLGATLAFGGVDLVHRFGPPSIPRLGEIAVDGSVLAATSLVALVAGVLAGIVPALRHGRRPPGIALRAGRSGTERGIRLRNVLVVTQVAVAVVLLSASGLLLNSFVYLRSMDPGFDPENLLSLRLDLKRPEAPNVPAWQDWNEVVARVAAVPGVRAAAGTTNPPFQSPFWAPWVRLPDEGVEVREANAGYAVTPNYFDLMGTRLLEGRAFGPEDGPDGPYVAIVNESWVRARLGGGEAIGQLLRFSDEEERMVTVVGVVEDVIQDRVQEGRLPAIYVPYTQADWPFVQVVARLDLPAASVVPEVRTALAAFSPYVPPRDVRTMDERMAATRTDPRFQTLLISTFALLALLLASAGLYGSLSHAVSRRRRELGIRVALGAARRGLVAMVVGQGLRLSVAGSVLGLGGAVAVTRLLDGFLYGVTPRDPWTYASVVAVLAAVAIVASFVPARRATTVDPVEVLGAE